VNIEEVPTHIAQGAAKYIAISSTPVKKKGTKRRKSRVKSLNEINSNSEQSNDKDFKEKYTAKNENWLKQLKAQSKTIYKRTGRNTSVFQEDSETSDTN